MITAIILSALLGQSGQMTAQGPWQVPGTPFTAQGPWQIPGEGLGVQGPRRFPRQPSDDDPKKAATVGPPTPWFNTDEDVFDPPNDPKLAADDKHDVEMGKKYAAEVLRQEKASTDMEYQKRVERIGQEIAHIANHTNLVALWGDHRHSMFHYRYTVLQGDDVNAFSLPGGYIFVYEGLMKFVESDDELASVLGHETSHAAFRHVATMQRDMEKAQQIAIPAMILAVIARNAGAAVAAQLGTQATASGWSINAEKAADYGGFQIMCHSKYNPVAMLTFMERLTKKDRAMDSLVNYTILQDHPVTKERVEAFINDLKSANIPIERSKASPSFRVALKDCPDGSVDASFDRIPLYKFAGAAAKARAEETAAKLNHFFDAVPQVFEVREDGDSHAIEWRGEPLLTIDPQDARACDMSQERLLDRTLAAFKSTLFDLNYRVSGSGLAE